MYCDCGGCHFKILAGREACGQLSGLVGLYSLGRVLGLVLGLLFELVDFLYE
jgi:hypothetical protein